jgi:hypothetical protein
MEFVVQNNALIIINVIYYYAAYYLQRSLTLLTTISYNIRIFPSLMQQKFTVTLILYSRHVSAIHGHHQLSGAMLNCCTVLHVTIACG